MTLRDATASKDATRATGSTDEAGRGLCRASEAKAFHDGFKALIKGASETAATAIGQSDLQRARTLRRRAGFELALDPEQSLATLAEARRIERSTYAPSDRREQATRETLARCHSLAAVGVDEVSAILSSTAAVADKGYDGIEREFLIPWLIAIGETARARSWLDGDGLDTATVDAASRRCQVDLVEEALRAADGDRPMVLMLDESEARGATPNAWLQLQINCYWHVVSGNAMEAQRARRALARFTPLVPPAFRVRYDVCDAVIQTLEGGCEIDLAVPTQPLALFNIGPVLAGGEAVALGGTSESAARWYDWFSRAWPVHVLRAPAWPILVHRVRALLACRAGDAAAGQFLMEEAISIADRIGSRVEAALARVQYAELLALDPRSDTRKRWIEVSNSGRERCRALSIPYEHHAQRARMAATLGRFDRVSAEPATTAGLTAAGLTSREIEVLRLFVLGRSYREAGEQLDVSWRTVQSHAYNAYQKLGVSSKIAAVTTATRLHLL